MILTSDTTPPALTAHLLHLLKTWLHLDSGPLRVCVKLAHWLPVPPVRFVCEESGEETEREDERVRKCVCVCRGMGVWACTFTLKVVEEFIQGSGHYRN